MNYQSCSSLFFSTFVISVNSSSGVVLGSFVTWSITVVFNWNFCRGVDSGGSDAGGFLLDRNNAADE